MLKPPAPHQHRLEMVTLEELVPTDHLLRLIDRFIRFDFIREATAHLYAADNGRPAVDPVRLFKMLFIGYLFGIRSERQLVREIQVNVAYRWFLGLSLTDRVIDASTFSQNRRRRFAGTEIEQTIFDTIVLQAIEHSLIGGRVFYSDSTHLKASANKHRHDLHRVEQTPATYLAELNAAIDDDRAAHGKAPLPAKSDDEPPAREIKVSRIDPGQRDVYLCPNGQVLDYRTTNRQGYREYASTPAQCALCPVKGQCTRSANGVKVVIRHVWEDHEDHKEAVDAHRLTQTGKRLYKRRKETVERSFADAKELHGHRYARFRGLAKVRGQALLAGACQNMKKMARLLARAAERLLRRLNPIQKAVMPRQHRLRQCSPISCATH